MGLKIFKKVFVCAAACALVPAALSSCGRKIEIDTVYTAYEVEHADLQNYINVTGTVKGSDLVKVTSDLSCRIESISVELGSSVKAGDVLCVFDSSDLQAEYDMLAESAQNSDEHKKSLHEINQRSLDNAKSDKTTALEQAQRVIDRAVTAKDNAYTKYADLEKKKNDLTNQVNSLAGTPDEQYAEAYQSLKETEAEYNALGEQLSSYDAAVQDANDSYASIEKSCDLAIQSAQDILDAEKYDVDKSSQAQLDKLKEKIESCTVKAPKDGIITSINAAVGSIPTTDAIMTIENADNLIINAEISESDILKISVGQTAEISSVATGKAKFSGKVSRVVNIMSGAFVSQITGEQQGGGYSAEISIDDPDSKLLIGMTAKVKIVLEEKTDVIAVPYDSILTEDDGSSYVFAVSEDGAKYVCRKCEVETGLETNYLTEVKSDSLNDGDLIVVSPAENMQDGQKILIDTDYQVGDGEAE